MQLRANLRPHAGLGLAYLANVADAEQRAQRRAEIERRMARAAAAWPLELDGRRTGWPTGEWWCE
jgi:hypothetical protein